MNNTKSKSIVKWLVAHGFQFKQHTSSESDIALMVSTDYDGLYPTREVLTAHEEIRKACMKRGLKTEPRGYKTAILIS